MRSSIAISSRCQPATWARISRTLQPVLSEVEGSPYHTRPICSSESPSTVARSESNPASISRSRASLLTAASDAFLRPPLADVTRVLAIVPTRDEQDVRDHVSRLEHRLRHRRQSFRQRRVAALKLRHHLRDGKQLARASQE